MSTSGEENTNKLFNETANPTGAVCSPDNIIVSGADDNNFRHTSTSNIMEGDYPKRGGIKKRTFECDACKAPFPNAENLKRHQKDSKWAFFY